MWRNRSAGGWNRVKGCPSSLASAQRLCGALSMAACLLVAAREGFQLSRPMVAVAAQFVVAGDLVLYCYFDARIRGRPLPLSNLWLFLCFWPVTVPAYWAYHYGWCGVRRVIVGASLLGFGFVGTIVVSQGLHSSLELFKLRAEIHQVEQKLAEMRYRLDKESREK
jgi:hypothetical protein